MSANYPAAAFVIMMVTTVLLVPSSAAPTYHESNSDSWWYNACGHHKILHEQSKSNHNRSDAHIFRDVKTQMKIFHNSLSDEIKRIKNMCAGAEIFDKIERKSINWLPKYKKSTNRNRSKTALKELHSDLQYYVVAVNYLEKIHVHTDASFNSTERKKAFENIFFQIKSLVCEVEYGVNITGQEVTSRVTPDFPQQKGLKKDYENITEMCLLDKGVLHKLGDFIRRWNNNLMKRLPAGHKRESEIEKEDIDSVDIDIDIEEDDENEIFE